ncbi:hypothetical protein HU734_008785 [Pseudomonas wayambapalatensis]|nr:hypothetical protein HU734_008785 [Pseudomonas wayambapalatensis]
MEIDRAYRFTGHRGVTFDVIEFTVRADNCCWLNTLHIPTTGRHQYRVVGKVKEVYERMQAGQLPCVMAVAVSLPLTREQGDALNSQRWTVAALVSAGGAAVTGTFAPALVVGAAKMGTFAFVSDRLPTFHAGDVLVSVEAKVQGGIGPQRSSTSLLLKAGVEHVVR